MAILTGLFTGLPSLAQTSLWVCIPLSIISLTFASKQTAALSTLVLLPPAAFLWTCSESAVPGHIDRLIWTFLGTGTLGLAAVAAVQVVLSYAYAYLLFGAQASDYFTEFQRANTNGLSDAEKKHRAAMAHSWRYIVFLVLFTFTAAGLLEEVVKYLAIAISSRTPLTELEYLQCAIAGTLGFSVVENIGFIYAARKESISMLALTVLERIFLGMPAHALSGCLIATGMIQRDLRGEESTFWRIIAAPTMYHGTFDFVLFALSAAKGNVGWIHPKDLRTSMIMFASVSTVLAAAFVHLKHNMTSLGIWG